MSFNKTTTVAGLSGEQYDALSANQVALGEQAKEGFEGADARFDGVTNQIIEQTKSAREDRDLINANTNTGFANVYGSLDTNRANIDALTQSQATANSNASQNRKKYYDDMISALQTNTGGLGSQITAGFDDTTDRFNAVDQSNTNLQTSVDQGFVDAQNSRNQMGVDVNSAFETQNTGLNTAFNTLGTEVGTAFDTTNENIDTTRGDLTEGQSAIASDLNTTKDNLDSYGTGLTQGQEALQSGQDTFKSSFDTYVDRYGDDTTLANRARSDMALAASNRNDLLREDIGRYAQSAAEGQSAIGKKIGVLGDATGTGFEVLSGTIEGGFNDTAAGGQKNKATLAGSIDGIRNLLQTTGDNLDAATTAQYSALADSFDQNGELIANSIDAQGNTIRRSMDDQGILLESRMDAAGNDIGSIQMDVSSMLANAEEYENSLSRQIGTLTSNQEGLMSSTDDISNTLQDQNSTLTTEFDAQSFKMDTTLRDLAKVASAQSNIDMGSRQDFKQLSDAFDDQGILIKNSIGDNGNTISRAIDDQGNLLLRAFDTQGRALGDKYVDINKTLATLNDLKAMPGANAGMGNLSPAMQSGSGGAITSGFMSPYATTR